jgi:sugar lactone lactonase YvrE
VGTNGIITTVAGNGYDAGTGYGGYSGDGGAATNAELSFPLGVAVDVNGNLFIADTYNNRIRKVDNNGIITTVAGGGNAGDQGVATNAELSDPQGVAVDANGNLFIADTDNSRIRKVDTNWIISTVAGNGTASYSGDEGTATDAVLHGPCGVAVDFNGNLFIADTDNSRIRKVGANGIITTVAGGGTNYPGDGGVATNAELSYPQGVAVDANGRLFIADTYDNRIRKVDINGIITTVAGGGTNYPGDGGVATEAGLWYPQGVAVDAKGNLFIADSWNNRIRKVDTNGIITTAAGNGTAGYSGDGGVAANAELSYPQGLAVDVNGNLFLADADNNRIRKLDTNGIITTVAGNGTWGYSGDGGPANHAELDSPADVAVDTTGNLFIADSGNNVIRKVLIPGPTLVLNDVGFGNAGAYDVVVSNPYGSVTSSVVILTTTLPPVVLSAPQITVGNTNFAFLLSGPSGSNYVLQVSTNLANWSSVSTSIIPVSGSITFSNAMSDYNRRFYRVYLQ